MPKVAVLLSTYNGTRYLEPQIRSLKENTTPFTLHWLDDHSTDDTREVLRASAFASGIDLCEWHQPQHQGVPGAFFQLVECVDADIYLFCDQDDIWQPGKIDATVANLLPDMASPALCFSNAFIFKENEPELLHRAYDVFGAKSTMVLQESRLFISNAAMGNTVGFTRPLREIFLQHKDVARAYAAMHDWWLYIIAAASGTARMLSDVPTTLYRLHGSNTAGAYLVSGGINDISRRWRLQQANRRWVSRQAEGFRLASTTLPAGPKLERLLAVARLVATLDRRQSPAALVRLARRGAMPPAKGMALWLAAACLCSNASA